ncbi:hypothetical protein FNH05_00045 [Amycolatopsis rhizosphaerae]|uniref:DUF485 domain-containing protein n=1 Tax=Amycolatopsis rhizosphaerae TaxID=2053003 RepID=A0A558DPK6_9PSEU|nr:hypothetical protein [Amycolatopsis rhizosphaerae]TVT62937.1 hypothetical protein FNH05_00045 [Amycolatopsis rhizosphaerae]
MNEDVYRSADGIRGPEPARAPGQAPYEPAKIERVPPAPGPAKVERVPPAAEPVEAPPESPSKPPKRQRVVLADPRSKSTPTLRALVELEEQNSWGTVLITDLVRRQLRSAVALAAIVVMVLGGLPLAFYLSPDFASAEVIGLPLAWLLLAVLPFPLLLLAGLSYNRVAERHEREFVDMIEN